MLAYDLACTRRRAQTRLRTLLSAATSIPCTAPTAPACPVQVLAAPPPPPPTFEVVFGSCTVKGDMCVYSDNFGPGQEYADNQDCVIKQSVPFPLDVRSFDVENHPHGSCGYDFLKVNGVKYCATEGPRGVTPAAGSELVWHTDESVPKAGFKICPVSRQHSRATSSGI